MNSRQPVSRRHCLKLSASALWAAALPLPSWSQLSPAPFEFLDLDWADPARQRLVPVRLYLPAAGPDTTPAPLVVFSHGIGGSRRGYSWLGQHFASQGMASLHLQHVGSDRSLWSGSVFSLVGRLQTAAADVEAIARVQDLRFALDTVLAGPWRSRLDAQRIVAAGHSYGANTTLLACGARVAQGGRTLDLADGRLRAAIVISAPPFYGQGETAAILQGVRVPSLHVTATEDVIRIPGYFSGIEDRLAVFEAIGSERKWLAVFEGGSHSMFTDRGGTGGVTLNPRVKNATRELATAFVQTVFHEPGALANPAASTLATWPLRHAEILARFAAPSLPFSPTPVKPA